MIKKNNFAAAGMKIFSSSAFPEKRVLFFSLKEKCETAKK